MSEPREQTLLILGATGDLSQRLLLPGLGALLATGRVVGLSLLGAAAPEWDDERWRQRVTESFRSAGATGEEVDAVAQNARYRQVDATSPSDLRELLEASKGGLVVYFALPPAITVQACEALTEIGGVPEGTRLVMEKPFGTDAASAEALNGLLASLVPEQQVHRVDHFLGLSTVLNIVGLRFANRMVEPVLNAGHVESVDIIWDEDLALEGRAGYFDATGALTDMFQSHLLQVLSLVAMEPPSSIDARDFRDAKAQVLRATRVWDDDPVTSSRRARYTAGRIDGRQVPAYLDEEGIPPDSTTETLAEVRFAVDTWRWAGVPFRLRSGKALGEPRKEIVVTFKPPPRLPAGLTGNDRPDRLRIGIGFGADRLHLDLTLNGPGNPKVLDPVTLEARFGAGDLPEYGQVLEGILDGDPTLSVRGDTAVECWRIIEPVLDAWRAGTPPLQEYPAGSHGPADWPLPGQLES
ncbi:glucose-6-phosphate dehydrogenase [Geodermatophilus sp. TF02-6]|uniref:glucose-6-phosphate dehydrogenase n=1 Tax=Geodermatophilus sp. TF02-6 TaxID=2250575 RepID=UPI001F1F7132|nr:glucose-6-phosphate dehydrogenase [Geodermatophilus sp. TF02-6]